MIGRHDDAVRPDSFSEFIVLSFVSTPTRYRMEQRAFLNWIYSLSGKQHSERHERTERRPTPLWTYVKYLSAFKDWYIQCNFRSRV